MSDETPEEREKRFLEKAKALGPQEWATPEAKEAYPKPDAEPEDRARKLVEQTFHPAWADRAGESAAQTIKKSPAATQAAQAVARKLVQYAQWVQSQPGKGTLPVPAQRAEQKYWEATYAEKNRRDQQELELQALKEKIRAVRDAAQPAQDLGDVDAVGVRQPIQMQREFSNEQEKQAYLERLKATAIKNAKK